MGIARPTDLETIAIEKIVCLLISGPKSEDTSHSKRLTDNQSPEVKCKAEGERETLSKSLNCGFHRKEQVGQGKQV